MTSATIPTASQARQDAAGSISHIQCSPPNAAKASSTAPRTGPSGSAGPPAASSRMTGTGGRAASVLRSAPRPRSARALMSRLRRRP